MIRSRREYSNQETYDVVIIGGALAGASTAILLLRERPELKILILEKSSAFGRRVGEATVEVSGYFLSRMLGLMQHLNEAHLVKQGMRFWFFNSQVETLDQCAEIGTRFLSRLPSFQVDRSVLDAEVLRRAEALGATVWRPATAGKVQLAPGGQQRLEVRFEEQRREVQARWIIDGSGVAALLARQHGWWRPNHAHPTTAVWARWTGVQDWDGFELAKRFPDWAMACHGIRGTATNHLLGHGWWAWVIPLKGGDVSIGVVFDQRLVAWPEGGSLGQRLKDFLMQHPAGHELLKNAHWLEGDVHWRKNLPYYSTTYAGDGFALVGDAAAFLDPLYSPGMDWVSYTAWSTAQLILAQQRGEDLAPLLARHNRDFSRSYERWFEAVYRDKYEYMAEFDLMGLAFLMDAGLYAMGVVSQPFKRGTKAYSEPVFSTPPSTPFYYFIRSYNVRLAAIARRRKLKHELGRHNHCRRLSVPGFSFAPSSSLQVIKAMAGWVRLELTEGWKTWFTGRSRKSGIGEAPVPENSKLQDPSSREAPSSKFQHSPSSTFGA